MTLSNWIIREGPKNIAKKLRVDPSTVCLWKKGRAFPRAKTLVKIHRMSRGKVTYAEIIEHYAGRKQSKKEKKNG